MTKKFQLSFVLFFTLFVVACGGGSTSSDELALTEAEASAVTGTFMGSSSQFLRNVSTDQIVDQLATEVAFDVNRDGVITFSDSSGSTGSAQLTNNLSFSFQSDARTQFDGVCQSGVIFLQGTISGNTINAVYSSESLICGGENFIVEGNIFAER